MEIEKIIPREITSERAQRYKRNTIGISALLIILLNFDFIDYSNSKIFGIAIKPKPIDSDVIIYSILGIVLLYNLIMYGTLLWRDWNIWKMSILNNSDLSNYPQFRMYLGINPSKSISMNIRNINNLLVKNYKWNKTIHQDYYKWIVEYTPKLTSDIVSYNPFNGKILSSKYIKIIFINFLFQDILTTTLIIITVITSLFVK